MRLQDCATLTEVQSVITGDQIVHIRTTAVQLCVIDHFHMSVMDLPKLDHLADMTQLERSTYARMLISDYINIHFM